ncbi:hypothetical protein SUDANB105_08193 (plasmid) [Streptomyces sp. enrichment culture]|uniref:hypothetical protein n=1 Tax=Streptomyces sp. enrichment culture TaxID=1795815 RepID=UPI003F5494FC
MSALTAILTGAPIQAVIAYELARLITPDESRFPPLARLKKRRAVLEDAERWCVGLRLHDRIDQAAYRHRLSTLAHGRRRPLSELFDAGRRASRARWPAVPHSQMRRSGLAAVEVLPGVGRHSGS